MTEGAGPLAGRTVVLTRARGRSAELAGRLVALGARVVESPVIAFEEPADWAPVDEAIGRLDGYRWLLFTSANAVGRFLSRARGAGVATLPGDRVAAIGEATAAALREEGITPAMVAGQSHAEGLLASLTSRGEDLAGRRILLPRAGEGRDVLPDGLRAAGAIVDVVTVYRTIRIPPPREVVDLIAAGAVDVVAFTSGSTVRGFLEGIGGADRLRGVTVAVIGPVTADAARSAGLAPAILAPRATTGDLADAIASHFAAR